MPSATVTRPDSKVAYTEQGVSRGPSSASVLSEDFLRAASEVTDLLQLQEGWDSYGARAIDRKAVDRALAFLTIVATHLDGPVPAPIVGPSADGGVTFRWEIDHREIFVSLLADAGEFYITDLRGDRIFLEEQVGNIEVCVRKLGPYFSRS